MAPYRPVVVFLAATTPATSATDLVNLPGRG
jgi:hypothetical protein